MPWPARNHDPTDVSFARSLEIRRTLLRNEALWCDILRSQLPRVIREEFVMTLMLIALDINKPTQLLIKARKMGSTFTTTCTIDMPVNEYDISALALPDEFVAKLCVVA
jgi:hypothetical protein